MLSPLSSYLWKEWREQRATLALLAVLLCAGVAAVSAALPRELAADPLAFQGAVALSLLATVMSVGSDLLARERTGGGLSFLERLPGGLWTAFRAKLVFFVAVLAGAALYGALLASAAALLRAGQLPTGLLEGSAPWLLAVLVAVSLWVFAVSAWMPASALTFPATLLLLGAFAWPAVLSLAGNPLLRPSAAQGLGFAALCAAGAPLSACAAFVFGSRLGRTRRRAAFAGLSVAMLFFAPAWIWAAGRYASLANAPFEVHTAWASPSGRHAFLDLVRRPPVGLDVEAAERWERGTALIVDLERGSWDFPGTRDASLFAETRSALRFRRLSEPVSPTHLRLLDGARSLRGEGGRELVLELDSARVLSPEEATTLPPAELGPGDFGLQREPEHFFITQAGLGHRLSYRDGGLGGERYRSRDGELVVAAEDLPRGATGRELFDVRVRPGLWIARDVHSWVWLDPARGERGELARLPEGAWIGPMVEDGRLLMVHQGAPSLVDPVGGERVPLRFEGGDGFELRTAVGISGMTSVGVAPESMLIVSGRLGMRLAALDVRAGTLTLGPTGHGRRLRVLWTRGAQALVLENSEAIVRHDLDRGTREVLFSVDDLR